MAKYNVISPDGFTIRQENFASKKKANEYLLEWIKRYQKQKWYSKFDGTKIPWTKIPFHCQITKI